MVVAETGRQPVDNPDTHLELTMIHEGPLLEYAGRDLALLQWAAAAATGSSSSSPRRSSCRTRPTLACSSPSCPSSSSCCARRCALTETLVAKMRILLAPRLLGVAALVALLGVVAWLVETA